MTATIHRDGWGMPHIRAASETEAYRALGYAQAEDHLTLMLRHYWQLRGELSTVVGRSTTALRSDVYFLRWRHLEEARLAFDRLSPQIQSNARAFVAGVEEFIAAHPERASLPVPPLEPAMPLALMRALLSPYFILEGLRVCMTNDVEIDPEVCEIVESLAAVRRPLGQSNEWLIRPDRTQGAFLGLLSDPHGSLDGLPMFEVSLKAGDLEYVGFHIIGALHPMLGNNNDVAWGCTTGNPSVSDCYAVRVDEGSPLTYQYDGQTMRIEQVEHTIGIKGELAPERRTFEYTQHNGIRSAVVARTDTTAYVISTPYMEVAELQEQQLYDQLRARNVDDVYRALSLMGHFPQNVLVGDRQGGALYVRMGRTPIRPEGLDLRRPLDGNTSATAWRGIHPIEDLVQIRDPECGYLQNNNISPDRMTADTQGTTLEASRYPEYIFGDKPGRTNDRGRRAVSLLSSMTSATIEDLLDMVTEDRLPETAHWIRALTEALAVHDREPAELSAADKEDIAELRDSITAFDGRSVATSAPSLHYWYWRVALLETEGVTDALLQRIEAGSVIERDEQAALVQAIAGAARELRRLHGSTELVMGDVFRIGDSTASFPGRSATIRSRIVPDQDHPFDSLDMTLQLMIYGPPGSDGRRFAIQGSHTLRFTAFTEPLQSWSLLNYGQSTEPDSPHRLDQAELFSRGELKRIWFTDAELEPHIVSTTTLA